MWFASTIEGSPPRGRGRQGVVRERARTPQGAHPRAGGDGEAATQSPVGWIGLTPARAGTALPARAGVGVTASRLGSPPRGRGRLAIQLKRPASSEGSPPRGRGRLSVEDLVSRRPGLTPARAGTAQEGKPCRHLATGWAHPRAGGDGVMCIDRASSRPIGSPPRGRGRPTAHRSGSGSPPRGRGRSSGGLAPHPRSGGSPPRGRGRTGATPRGGATDLGGSPPRGRGRPSSWPRSMRSKRAHPRAGGDGLAISDCPEEARGSPPRGRGRTNRRRRRGPPRGRGRAHPRGGARAGGATPARAGTACGPGSAGTGLTPARAGTDRCVARDRILAPAGLTPARAGTTADVVAAPLERGAHPRAGGDGDAGATAATRTGSPPRGRGRLQAW